MDATARIIIFLVSCCSVPACGFVAARHPPRRTNIVTPPTSRLSMSAALSVQREGRDNHVDNSQLNIIETDNTGPNDGFDILVKRAIQTLYKSDTDGEELDHSYGSASQGLWLHSPTAKEMQKLLDRMVLKVRVNI